MVNLNDIQVFVCVAENKSFSGASKTLEISPAVASAAIKRLELSLKTQLFVRTTRSLSITQAGLLYLKHAKNALDAIRSGESAIALNQEEISGRLSISLPSDLGRGFLRRTLNAFHRLHPKLEIKVTPTDRISDLYKSPVDVAIRYGVPSDSSLYATPLVSMNQRVVCASPKYFQHHGKPSTPDDLTQHRCLCFLLNDVVHNKWQFGYAPEIQTIAVSGNKVSDDGDMVRQWAVDGEGIAYKSRLDVLDDIRAGKLEMALENCATEPAPLNLITAQKISATPATQALHSFLVQAFEDYLSDRQQMQLPK
ncbi:MAG: LysR substrate-binding domain-containing protein [Methylophilus sp.]|nr:LysR substrate-binding domain-containing protein [Methylophilus sp.]